MPTINLSTVSATSEWHEYQPPDQIDGGIADAHFEVRNANNAWGYEVIDLRFDRVYTKGFFDLTLGFGGGNPKMTVLMLCNPYAHLYPHPGMAAFPSGPDDPVISVNGQINAYVDVAGGSSQNPNLVLWSDNGKAFYPDITSGHAVPFGVNGPIRFVGRHGDKSDRIYGGTWGSSGPGGQQFPMLGIYYKDLTIWSSPGSAQIFNASARYGRFGLYNCELDGNHASTGYSGYGIQFCVRMPHGGSIDFRDVVAKRAEEHFIYHNSLNNGLVDEDSWVVRCSVPEGQGRTFIQMLDRAEETPGPGKNVVLIDQCSITGCSQQGQSADITIAGFHGTFILRDCYDEPIPVVAPLQKRSILAWSPGNKSESDIPAEGDYYHELGGSHGKIVIINHRTTKPNIPDSSHWAFTGAKEVHIFNPQITGNRHAIEFDHDAHTEAGPQYDAATGAKGYDPDFPSLGGTVYSNNPFHTASLKRKPVNGPGMTAGAIGPGYEHIYTDGASYADWDGIDTSGSDLVRNDSSNPDLDIQDVIQVPLDPQDYWSPMQLGGGGSCVVTASLSTSIALAAVATCGSLALGLLTSGDPGTPSMTATARGDCFPVASAGVAVDLAATASCGSLALGLLVSGDQAHMIASASGSSTVAASANVKADLDAVLAAGSGTFATLTDGSTATMVALADGAASVDASAGVLVDMAAAASGTSAALGLLTSGRIPSMFADAEGTSVVSASPSALLDCAASAAGSSTCEANLTSGRSPSMVATIAAEGSMTASPNFLVETAAFYATGSSAPFAALLIIADGYADLAVAGSVTPYLELDGELDTTVSIAGGVYV